jgi:type IV fimbrial biogenesis protein FimT
MVRRAPSKGFTVIELMIVVLVVGILAMIAAPSFSQMLANNRIKAASSNLHMSLLRARSEAVKRNSSVVMARTGAHWGTGWTLTWDNPATAAVDPITLASEAAPAGVTISPNPGPASVTYLSSGRIQGAAVAFTVDDAANILPAAKSRCVSVSLSGMPVVKEGACP